ncbi:hypothetical protein ACIRJO_38090 [Streptomyces sp. NPDC102394]|uniref:hypothetical protein n=1 Tax=Streptomyces sp. NPDC102394 TaxID=3366167 RepID=UPI00382CD1B0
MSSTLQTAAIAAIVPSFAALIAYANYRRAKPKVAISYNLYSRGGYAYFKIRLANRGGTSARVEGVKLHVRHRQFSPLRRKYPYGLIADLDVIEGGDEREIEAYGGIRWVARTKDPGDLTALRRVSRLRLYVEQSNGDRSFTEWLYKPGRWFWVLVNSTHQPDPWDIRSV